MAKQSLFAQQNPPAAVEPPASTAMTFPGGENNLDNIEPPEKSGPDNSFVMFANPKSDRWQENAAAFPGLQKGEALLILRGGDTIRLGGSLTYYLVDGFRFWAEVDTNGAVTAAYAEERDDIKASECFSALVILLHEGRMIPATIRFKDAMAAGPLAGLRELQAAKTKEWLAKSAEHALAASIPDPRFRFKTLLSWGPKKSRSSGRTYMNSTAKFVPSSAADSLAFRSQDVREDFDAAKGAFDSWVAEVKEKM